MSFYIDTSALAAFYCPEPLSNAVDEFLTSTMEPVVSSLTEVELYSAVARKVRMAEMELAAGHSVIAAFRAHLEGGYYRRITIESRHYEHARDLIATFSVPLRSLDALHAAVALQEQLTFVTSDKALAAALRSFGGDVHLFSSD